MCVYVSPFISEGSSSSSSYYSVCIQPATALLEHTSAKTEISNPEDDSSILAFATASFPWYGENITADLYFGSNGYISLNQSDVAHSTDSKGDGDGDAGAEVS